MITLKSCCLSMAMVASVLGLRAQSYGGGDGSAANPYLISTAEHLQALSSSTNGGTSTAGVHYRMTADISLQGTLAPIGDGISTAFKGNFDGAGHSISNLNVVNNSSVMTFGLFGRVAAQGRISNVTVASGSVTAHMCGGGIAGASWGTIENCVNHASVTVTNFYAGGIVGGNYGTISGCENRGAVAIFSGQGYGGGGVAGTNHGTIVRCSNHGSVEVTFINAGGIAGDINNGSILNCYNRGSIYCGSQVGGLVGQINTTEGPVNVRNSYNASIVSGDAESTGALFGDVVAYNVGHEALFFDQGLCAAGIGFSNEDFDVAAMARTAAQMQSQAFIDNDLGVGQGAGMWFPDTENVNAGYPVLNSSSGPTVTYTVTCVAVPAAGGTVAGAGVYALGAEATVTATPADGYVFVNWIDAGTIVSLEPSYTFVVEANRNLVATFDVAPEPVAITVTCVPAEGGTVAGAGVYAIGSTATLTATPSAGYIFVGWARDGEILSLDAEYSFTVTEALDLQAIFDGSTAIDDQPDAALRVYPNPVADFVAVEGDGLRRAEVYNLAGMMLQYIDIHNGENRIDISGLQSGVYLLRVSTTDGVVIRRMVKR